MRRLLSLVLALGMFVPQKARARSRSDGDPPNGRPPERRPRRAATRSGILQFPARRSPGGKHVVEVDGGAVFVDGRRVHPALGAVEILSEPCWRPDGSALAWMERGGGETRLLVLPEVARVVEPIAWPLPRALANDRVHWVGPSKIVIGPEALQPRAVASWD
jgi:hypothetical protein